MGNNKFTSGSKFSKGTSGGTAAKPAKIANTGGDWAGYHQKQVAKSVLKTNDVMNSVLGGPSRAEAKKILGK